MTHSLTRAALVLAGLTLASGAAALAIDAETDTNADGLLSFEELQAAVPDITEELFILIDRTEDGLVDADELAEAEDAALIPLTDG
ncbi:MAG: hypothetical protein AAFR53_14140 [Pseudomonadota bacterium]